MEQSIDLVGNLEVYVWVIRGLVIYAVLLSLVLLVALLKLRKIQSRYEIFMRKENVDLEQLLTQYAKKVDQISSRQIETEYIVQEIKEDIKLCIKKVGVVRYQAIQGVGADLSFVVALLDEHENGVVLNGIYSRDGSYTYAKPIEAGQSKYKLSEEELKALNVAKSK